MCQLIGLEGLGGRGFGAEEVGSNSCPPPVSHSSSNVPSPRLRVKGILVVNPEDEKGGNVGDCFKWTALPASASGGTRERQIVSS